MSFLSFLGKVFLLDWLLGDDEEKVPQSPKQTYDYGREDDYFDRVHSLENRIVKLERQQDRCDILSNRYDGKGTSISYARRPLITAGSGLQR